MRSGPATTPRRAPRHCRLKRGKGVDLSLLYAEGLAPVVGALFGIFQRCRREAEIAHLLDGEGHGHQLESEVWINLPQRTCEFVEDSLPFSFPINVEIKHLYFVLNEPIPELFLSSRHGRLMSNPVS